MQDFDDLVERMAPAAMVAAAASKEGATAENEPNTRYLIYEQYHKAYNNKRI